MAADHTLTSVDSIILGNSGNASTPGDGYIASITGGTYEITAHAGTWGSGITLSRVMPDGTTLAQIGTVTADGRSIFQLAAGRIKVAFGSNMVGGQVVFGRVK